jgi:hypothetical protein
MKKSILLFVLVCATFQLMAQNQPAAKSDRIYKADNTVIDCKIMEVTGTEIKYKKANYLDGPTYSINKTDVVTIRYANGDSEVMNNKPAPTGATSNNAAATNDNSNVPTKGSSRKFYEYVGNVYFSNGTYIGGDYDFFWRLDDDSKSSNMYLGFGLQAYYGFGTTGTYGNTGVSSAGKPINISAGDLSSSVIYFPAQFRIFPSNSSFFIEAQLGPAINFWSWDGTTGSGSFESDSGTKVSISPGINAGFISKSGFGLSARWNSALGFGLGLNISYLERNK